MRHNKAIWILSAMIGLKACGYAKKIQVYQPELKTYSSCQEIKDDQKQIADQYENLQRHAFTDDCMNCIAASAPVMEGSGKINIVDNRQTQDIEELDVFKISDQQMFYAIDQAIVVINRLTRKQVGMIELKDLYQIKILVKDRRLWVLARDYSTYQSVVKSYTLGESLPVLEKSISISGQMLDGRVKDGILVLAVQSYAEVAQSSIQIQSAALGERMDDVDCRKISRPLLPDNNWAMTKILSIRLTEEAKVADSIASIGTGNTLYMSSSSLYLVKSGFSLCYGNCAELFEGVGDPKSVFEDVRNSSFIIKVGIDSASAGLTHESFGMVKGDVKDSWALQEFNEESDTFVAVTSTERGDFWEDLVDTNHLTILKEEKKHLRRYSMVENFGDREDVRSVRYVDRMAYVVTFEKTDPLWAISLEDLKHPEILGSLEVPGFSTYLHPVSSGTLIGVGLDATVQGDFSLMQGLQLSLFDTRNPMNLSRRDNLFFGGRGSYSHASSDRHAFYYDEAQKIMALPTVEFNQVPESSWDMGDIRLFSGARFFRVNEESGRIQQLDAVSHFEMMPRACEWKVSPRWGWHQDEAGFDIQRIVRVDGQIITLSPYGQKVWNMNVDGRMTPLQSEVFTQVPRNCENVHYPYQM